MLVPGALHLLAAGQLRRNPLLQQLLQPPILTLPSIALPLREWKS